MDSPVPGLTTLSKPEIASRLDVLKLSRWKGANQKMHRRQWWLAHKRGTKTTHGAQHYRSAGTKPGGKRRIPLSTIAGYVGYSRSAIYLAAKGEMSEPLHLRLSMLLHRLDEGTLRFERRGQQWQAVFVQPKPKPERWVLLQSRGNSGIVEVEVPQSRVSGAVARLRQRTGNSVTTTPLGWRDVSNR